MKTLEEFIQRLQDDRAFAKEAHAFDRGDELIAFVKREGYDFTLEQLMSEFERAEKSPIETSGLAPAPPTADVSPSPPPRPDEPESPWQTEVFSSPESAMDPSKRGNDDLTPEPLLERLAPPRGAMPPTEAEEEPRARLFRGGGGRHRGFSPQRLKPISEEEP